MNNKALTAHDSFFTISVYRGIHTKSSEGDTKAGGAGDIGKKHIFLSNLLQRLFAGFRIRCFCLYPDTVPVFKISLDLV